MLYDEFLTTADIKALFAEEIAGAGGTVTEMVSDASRLYARSILPSVREVRKADRLQGGVALRATEHDVWVHPYVFRQICSNGAIMAHAIQTCHIECQDFTTTEEAAGAVRAAIRDCCAQEAFSASMAEIRSATEVEADLAINLLPMYGRLRSEMGARVLQEVMDRFARDTDRSRFGLMNAVTSLARDTADPEVRWRLEELGGGIPAGRMPVLQPDDAMAERMLVG
jgi:hypothetical protein